MSSRKPTLAIALIPLISMIVFVAVGIIVMDVDPQIPLIGGIIVATLTGFKLNYSWDEMEGSIINSISLVMQACIIILIIGSLIAIWTAGGIVPTMIYYGLQLFTPKSFLLISAILCSIVSLSTGSSWTTAGTVGVAIMGIGAGLGIPPAITAGSVITGAILGDKMSPLSDSTNLAAGIAGADLFDHIRHMIYTTGPSYLISLILYFIIGLKYQHGAVDYAQISDMLGIFTGNFWISPIMLIAPAFVVLMVIFKIPAIPGITVATLVGVVFSFIQGHNLQEIINILHYGFEIETSNEIVDTLLTGGGLDSMMWTISLVICALAFGGVIEKIGCLDVIVETILKYAKSRGAIVLTNIVACIAMNFIAADQYMAIVIPGRMYEPIYKELNLHPKNLSRVLEDAGTLTSPLFPWTTCGAFYYGTLGVHAFSYLPYTFLALITPIISAIYGFTGITMEKIE